ncbi:hypothetical protein HYPSUDRAFT_201374 [Hypholoma sublateritium FD-334 SS-4]|uniref:Uncharacterized protein n=1 Tax=Hypholoma sublateritium (strain FD-334 SS-4) TaxID=945553 RepID=A0A0D2P3T3_HYPSF|nr:hypothetical protein HYPSUDRAFT_201374 [Hypholoma sublateritium FD-334 SS-4]
MPLKGDLADELAAHAVYARQAGFARSSVVCIQKKGKAPAPAIESLSSTTRYPYGRPALCARVPSAGLSKHRRNPRVRLRLRTASRIDGRRTAVCAHTSHLRWPPMRAMPWKIRIQLRGRRSHVWKVREPARVGGGECLECARSQLGRSIIKYALCVVPKGCWVRRAAVSLQEKTTVWDTCMRGSYYT